MGWFQISGGDETGQIGDVSFENFEGVNFSVICFAGGTLIATDRGEVAVEELAEDDLVRTMDHGLQPIRWIGATTVPARDALAPIEIQASALGNRRMLRVSPQHRMLLRGWQVQLLFGEEGALVAVKHLVNDSTIRPMEGGEITYFHILFDRREIVFAEGMRQEIFSLFPRLRSDLDAFGSSARRSLNGFEAAALRHQQMYPPVRSNSPCQA